jgi:transposase
MGRHAQRLELNSEARKALQVGYETGKSHAYRQRCQMMLLKNEARSSEDIAAIVGCCEMAVNNWVKRYKSEGLQGLQTKPGRGRKAILASAGDAEKIKAVVQENRQRLSVAKAELEEALAKQFSQKTLERHVKKVLVAINASENVLANSPVKRRMSISAKP